ncbi:MAG TPA: acyl-CoA dehydrogenase family protein [Actinomycetota bacterium]|jgi:alkylation response protein AidB-like acyl-CoA dehydrogenase|nr:acyl-CoA dehydrogenase family protein [Actinomycetota bacterium]
MDFGLNDDQETLQRYAREFLEKECPSTFVRSQMASDTAHEPDFYKKMAALGWMGIAIPEEHGGQGMTYVDLAVVLEEMGRAVVPGPFFASVCLAAPVIVESGADRSLLADIAAGDRLATVAYTEAAGRLDEAGIELTAMRDGDGYTLTGTKAFVPDAHVADTIIVAGQTPDGVRLFVVDAASPGLTITQHATMDTTRRLCELRLDGVKAGAAVGDWATLERGLQKAASLLAAECVGGAQKVLDMSVDYAKVRMQFGRPIGSFQAVKHRCADMLVDVEMARSAMYYAAWASSEEDPELPLASSIAKAYCGSAYTRVAANGIQVHGGIGFTWEHDMHLYFKRAKVNDLLFGDSTHHRDLVARLIAA